MNYIFVEGYYDEEFFNMLFKDIKDTINIKQYASEKTEKINNFIRTIKSMPNCSYVFFADSDGENLSAKKKELLDKYCCLEEEKIVIVCLEIESWIYAGLKREFCLENKIKYNVLKTEKFTKEQFIARLPKQELTTSFLIDILNAFYVEEAMQRNSSFEYFNKKRDELVMLFD